MKISSNLSSLKSHSENVTSGFCFIGSYEDNFHVIIKCPIYVYVVIKKAFANSSVNVSFQSGNLPLTHLVLSQFLGRFIYRDPSNKVRKYHAAFVYPLDLNYEPTEYEYQQISAVLSVFNSNKFEYYDKTDRSLKTLFTLFAVDFVEYLDSLVSAFDASYTGVSSIKTQQGI